VDDAALAVLAKEGYDPAYGARPVKRAIQRMLENPIARKIIEGVFAPGDTVCATVQEGRDFILLKKMQDNETHE
jgi:ATP-dependent Clp protease ATP-binding subunit ClpB